MGITGSAVGVGAPPGLRAPGREGDGNSVLTAVSRVFLMGRPKTTHFYATRADLEPGIRAMESIRSLKYVERGLFPDATPRTLGSALSIPNLGLSNTGDLNLNPFYLVLDSELPIEIRTVPQRRGGVMYAIDEVSNPTAMILAPGGLHEENCIIVGQAMASSDNRSQQVYRRLVSCLVRGFMKVDVYYVGPEALRLWREGARLTHSEKRPIEYDLRLRRRPQG